MGKRERAGDDAEVGAPARAARRHAAAEADAARAAGRGAPGPEVVLFYGSAPGKSFREFSNFYSGAPAFRFELPAFAREAPERGIWLRTVECAFAEKAIMLTKAALMNDEESFQQIARAASPPACKSLGRKVRGFDHALWTRHLPETAFEVVRQKFEPCKALRDKLLSTGTAVLAEAAPTDRVWGIGLGSGDSRARHPAQWQGRNVLGVALMRARSHLRGEDSSLAAAEKALLGPGRPKAVALEVAGDAPSEADGA